VAVHEDLVRDQTPDTSLHLKQTNNQHQVITVPLYSRTFSAINKQTNMATIVTPVPATPDIEGVYNNAHHRGNNLWPSPWNDLELGEDVPKGHDSPSLDLNMLWQVLEKHKEHMQENEEAGANISTTWELVVVQGVLLTLLIIISVSWALCCKKRCFTSSDRVSVVEALRKLSNASSKSKDLPPTYSIVDLHSLGISVQDHLNPPPNYIDLFRETDLQYLDLEAGHSRMARLSFCEGEPGSNSPPRMAKVSVASCASCNSEGPVIVPIRTTSVSSASSASTSTSRKSSRNSRVSFSDEVECSNGSIRRLSSCTLSKMGVNSISSSRKSSSSSDGSRRSSLIDAVQRKLGASSPVPCDEVRERLERIERQQTEEDINERQTTQAEVTAEGQAERAARICDVIVEEK